MIAIDPGSIAQIMQNTNGIWTVPDTIVNAISQKLTSDTNTLEDEKERFEKEFRDCRKSDSPINIDYYLKGEVSLDAYTAFYLPRYSLIPAISFRDLSLHSNLKQLPDEIKILDMGSGTGAITLGLLHFLTELGYPRESIQIVNLDCCGPATKRRKDLISSCGFDRYHIAHETIDFNHTSILSSTLEYYGPFDYIFTGSCLTELDHTVIDTLIKLFSRTLSEPGAIIIAEARRTYTGNLIHRLALNAPNHGLNVYYPCIDMHCSSSSCWCWREHSYAPPNIRLPDGKRLTGVDNNLTLNWLILTKLPVRILDNFQAREPELRWDIINKEPKPHYQNTENFGVCSDEDIMLDVSKVGRHHCRRGSIVGFDNNGVVQRVVTL
ncbi:hypothetical protein Dehly_1161 [Dehalogenimonas lykanthroporepellens BL-DC-9]|nr:hypothetical protein Dehly_1161 [Dehalogenimonas lykanthroporepellens BL-DC-9]